MAYPNWPPNLPSTGFKAAGVTTIMWGTDGLVPPAYAYIVKSVRDSQRVEEAKVENGTGLTATEIILIDGQDYEITVVDNVTVPPPTVGIAIALITPLYGTAAQGTFDTFLVINSAYNAARKQDGERVLLARSFTLFKQLQTILAPAVS